MIQCPWKSHIYIYNISVECFEKETAEEWLEIQVVHCPDNYYYAMTRHLKGAAHLKPNDIACETGAQIVPSSKLVVKKEASLSSKIMHTTLEVISCFIELPYNIKFRVFVSRITKMKNWCINKFPREVPNVQPATLEAEGIKRILHHVLLRS